jgi:hypothetical protein
LRNIHKRIVSCRPLQLDEAVEMVESPFEVDCQRPFGEELQPHPQKSNGGDGPSHEKHGKRPAPEAGGSSSSKKPRPDPKVSKGKKAVSHNPGVMK